MTAPLEGVVSFAYDEDYQNVVGWMKSNQLCLNVDKTHLLVAGTGQKLHHVNRNETVSINMDGLQLKESEEKVKKS